MSYGFFVKGRRDEAEATPAWLWSFVKDVWVAVRKGISKRNCENGKDDDDDSNVNATVIMTVIKVIMISIMKK